MSLVWELGLVEYGIAYNVQRRLHRQRLMEEIPDVLLLLEHPPTITIGKSGSIENVLVSREALSKEGVSLFFIDRGGDVTYHGPGQIVGYPIIDLKQRRKDIRRFVYDIEEVIIRTMKDFSIDAGRDESHPGVWVDGKELAAIGLAIRRWVSMHGFAINVNPNMEHFSLINPCGLNDREAISMSQLLGETLKTGAIKERLIAHFSGIFDAPVDLKTTIHT
ncbi:MAG: lipoyl(octanoyl) transferase LipB [Syntrophorhabdaceae bacterium]|nr:lipoyl(octanoyl) transferase LipB [Syntrophorhabdaceae bacterium]MDD5242843.1 lipoyl(octanoyl) transferase LipB [Syntrophorhabdaceae bacterium]